MSRCLLDISCGEMELLKEAVDTHLYFLQQLKQDMEDDNTSVFEDIQEVDKEMAAIENLIKLFDKL